MSLRFPASFLGVGRRAVNGPRVSVAFAALIAEPIVPGHVAFAHADAAEVESASTAPVAAKQRASLTANATMIVIGVLALVLGNHVLELPVEDRCGVVDRARGA